MSDSANTSSLIWDQLRARLTELEIRSEVRRESTAVIAEKLSRRALTFRERLNDPLAAGPVTPIVFFSTNRVRYGLPLESVLEIQPLETFSPVPGGPGFLHGVVHFRGAVLSLFNLTRLFDAPESGIADIHFYIVATSGNHRLAIAAGDVEDLAHIPVNALKPAPQWIGSTPHHWVQGVYEEDRVILNLDAILSDESVVNWNGRARMSS